MRVLLVEDHEAMADGVRRGLNTEGFSVDVASDGLDGLGRAREGLYDALILDIMLPGMNGYEICRTLRAEGSTTPILMLTAKNGEYDIAEGLELGADDYLPKPFSFVVLVARLRSIIRRSGTSPVPDPIAVGPLMIDPTNRSCSVHGKDVELSTREFSLLETLARNVGLPLSRGQLLDQVWGAEVDGSSNVVDVYVGYLRRKLAAEWDGDVIQTIRGHGYRLRDCR